MVSHRHRCIFIHIPKCAGTSIEEALGHFDGYSGRHRQDHRTIRQIEKPVWTVKSFSSRENALEVLDRVKRHVSPISRNPRNKESVTVTQFRSYFKFSFVRNPWARSFSWYQNVLRDPQHRRTLGVEGDIPFKMFLEIYAGKGALRPQTHWLRGFDGAIPLDFIGRFENLQEDFKSVCDLLGLEALALPHRIAGKGDEYAKYFDDEAKDLVGKVYEEEIRIFGYSFL